MPSLMRQRTHLEQRWRDRLERITALSLAYHDAAQGDYESRQAKMIARQAVAERQALAEIEAALDRLQRGTYGRCEECGRPIGTALLSARPQARYCGACGPHRRKPRRPAYAW
jgi:DnaK suppressor protein